MIALMIKAGYTFFHNELGVRLVALLMNVFSLLIVENLIVDKNASFSGRQAFLFYAIALSLAVLQISGFMAVPDIPLFFLRLCFFGVIKTFLATLLS